MVHVQPEHKIRQCTSCGEVIEPGYKHYCTVTVGYNPVPLSDLERALDNLLLADAPPYLADDDITVMRLVARAKCSPNKAKRLLGEWEAAGKVEYIGERREPRGHSVKAWKVKA
jgi:hypothetical protein